MCSSTLIYIHSFDYHISEGTKEDMPGLVCYMFTETFANRNFERGLMADFVLSILGCYRQNPYHNAEHAFCFTHTMYLILINNCGYFDFVEVGFIPRISKLSRISDKACYLLPAII